MNIYSKKVNDIVTTAGRANRSMRKRFLEPQLHKSGMEFLQRIKSECEGIGATEQELVEEREQLQIELDQKNAPIKHEKPELTVEYLKSKGLGWYCSW